METPSVGGMRDRLPLNRDSDGVRSWDDDDGLKSGKRRSSRLMRRRVGRRQARYGARDGDFHNGIIALDDHFLIGEGDVVLVGRAEEERRFCVVGMREEDGRRR